MEPTYCIYNKTRESFLGLNVACASTSLGRLKGLLGKLHISAGEGLWVVPSRGIHTVGLLSPIDLVYLDEAHCEFTLRNICDRSASVPFD